MIVFFVLILVPSIKWISFSKINQMIEMKYSLWILFHLILIWLCFLLLILVGVIKEWAQVNFIL
jgi:hypothetical protein